MRITLILVDDPNQKIAFQIRAPQEIIVGRDLNVACPLPVQDRYVSRQHFVLQVDPPRCTLRDLNPKNPTRINGHHHGIVELHDGDQIEVGKTQLTIHMDNGIQDWEALPSMPLVAAWQDELWSTTRKSLVEATWARWGHLRNDPSATLELIYQEYLLRRNEGEKPPVEEYIERFPDLEQPLREQFLFHERFFEIAE